MGLKNAALSLIKHPEDDHISKNRVAIIIFSLVLIFAIIVTIISQIKKNNYLAEQQAHLQQKKSQASSIPMATHGSGEDTKQYVDKQTKLKNQIAHNGGNNGLNDPLAVNQNVPPIVGPNGQPVNNNVSVVQNQQNAQSQDPIAQEYQNEKLDKIKHKYAAYRADTLLSPQPVNTVSPQLDKASPTLDNSQNIPQPQKLTSNQAPSEGYLKTSVVNSITAPNNYTESSTNQDQNLQTEKNNFLTSKAKELFSEDYVNSTVKDPISKYEIKAGTPMPAFLITPISSDLPGMVTAQVARNIYDTNTGNYLLIPGGSKLIGVYDSNIAYGQSRVMVAWNRVIFPNGTSYRLYGMPGTDAMGVSGLTGEVNNHYSRIFGAAVVIGIITAGMQYSQNNANSNVQVGATYPNPSVGQSLAAGLGQQLGQAGLQVTQKNLNIQPTIEIPPSQQINIMLTSDVILRPINKKDYLGNGFVKGK